ncbi:MAG: hypothetical protein QOG87_1792 [Actinomycetota bacterium]
MVRWALVVFAVGQLVVAVVLAVGPGTHPDRHRQVTLITPAESSGGLPAATTTTLPPVIVEAPTTTAAPAAVPVVPPGAVFGVIGAGAGGKARADLQDEAGNMWHSEADSRGGYRFDRLPPGRYQLILSAESAPEPCTPDGVCTGSAMAISKRIIDIKPGQEIREDYPVYGPTSPAVPTTTPAPTTTTAAPPPSTTTSTTAPR